jgi:succinoglycan biosynthesis transport protein ExoP
LNENRYRLPVPIDAASTVLPMAAADEMEGGQGMSLAQITTILRAHWKHSVIATLALVFVFAVIIKLVPKSYVATATLIVNYGDKDPLASNDYPAGTENTFIPTQIELMESPVVLGRVIKRLHLTSDPLFTRGFSGPPAALLALVMTNLRASVSVTQGMGSDLLYVSVTAKQPVEAARIANAIADEYLSLDRQRIDGPAAERAKRYSEELTQLRANTIRTQDRVTAFRQRHAMIDLSPEKADAAEAALKTLQQKLLAAQNTRRELQAQLQALSEVGGVSAGGIDEGTLSTKLADEELRLAHLSSTLGPRFPSVVALKSQIAATKRAIKADSTAQLASVIALEQKYQSAVDAQQKLVLQRRKFQDEGAKLLLELQSADATYKKALDGYDQIQFATAYHGINVSLISRATPPAIAVRPNKIKYFLMCVILSMGAGVLLPFAHELLLDRRLRCRDDLERHFGIPVLIQLQPITLQATKEAR